jgi:hypothetical protein
VDVSRDYQARSWGESVLREAPPGGVVHTSTDEHTFTLWYLQIVDGQRPDVAIVEDRLEAVPWYRQQLLRRYPQLTYQVG